jgi:hypothetical protein
MDYVVYFSIGDIIPSPWHEVQQQKNRDHMVIRYSEILSETALKKVPAFKA